MTHFDLPPTETGSDAGCCEPECCDGVRAPDCCAGAHDPGCCDPGCCDGLRAPDCCENADSRA